MTIAITPKLKRIWEGHKPTPNDKAKILAAAKKAKARPK